MSINKMQIKKRNGSYESLSFDKVLKRIRSLANDAILTPIHGIDSDLVAQKVVNQIYDGVSSKELDELAGELSIAMSSTHPGYGELASRIVISNAQKSTPGTFLEAMEILHAGGIINDTLVQNARVHCDRINETIDYTRDYLFDYFGYKTLERSYLLRVGDKVIERPQYMWMRVALGIHRDNLDLALETYCLLSQKYFIHASPTLFNVGTKREQLSSCFHENTIVATTNRGPVKIKDVEIGDSVVTHLGNVKKVSQLHKNLLGDRKFYDLSIQKTAPIKVTGNHKLWCLSKENEHTKPEWKSVEDLQEGDYIGIPNKIQKTEHKETLDILDFKGVIDKRNEVEYERKYDINFDEKSIFIKSTREVIYPESKSTFDYPPINRFWKIDDDFAKFIGIFYSNGRVLLEWKEIILPDKWVIYSMGIELVFCEGDHAKKDLIEFCKNTGKKLFGLTAFEKTEYDYEHERPFTSIRYNSPFIGLIFKECFGRSHHNKKIWNEIYSWNKNLIQSLLEGFTCDKNPKKLLNENFVKSFYYLSRNNNCEVAFAVKETETLSRSNLTVRLCDGDGNDELCKECIKNESSLKKVDGFRFLKFESKTEIVEDLPEYVYTLGVEDDHSYNVEGIIAQNCYLLGTEDSLEGIFKTITDCAKISKYAGGIGIHVSNIRARGSLIKGTNGKSDGIVPMLKTYNEVSRYINQGGKRNGSFAIYLEPWHADILEFLDLRKNTGETNSRARDLFYALWVCDLFMMAVERDEDWYLMCPQECEGLQDAYGEKFNELYISYVHAQKYKRVIKARDLWAKILNTQIETGMPYMSYKDHVNNKSNQKHLGTIKSSNLCNEITLYSDANSYGVCNIATIGLPKFVENGTFNFDKLKLVTKVLVRNLNNVIDINYYPTPETERNNLENRPCALGIQGLYDVFMMLKIPFDSPEASTLNKRIFECIQFSAIEESCELARLLGPYPNYQGSPMSQGWFQHNFWGVDENALYCNWSALREKVMKYGVRNALLTSLPPTASTSQILGNTESFEVLTSNIYKRKVLKGEYPIVNKHLVHDLLNLGLWNDDLRDNIILHDGSIQNIPGIPDNVKKLYRTTWEISQKVTIQLSADRAPFIDHSQSLNIFMAVPTVARLSSMHFYGWNLGLKTGSYYLRSRPISTAMKFSVQTNSDLIKPIAESTALSCSIDNRDACEMCSG